MGQEGDILGTLHPFGHIICYRLDRVRQDVLQDGINSAGCIPIRGTFSSLAQVRELLVYSQIIWIQEQRLGFSRKVYEVVVRNIRDTVRRQQPATQPLILPFHHQLFEYFMPTNWYGCISEIG